MATVELVRRATGEVVASAELQVEGPPGEQFDHVLEGDTLEGDVEVPAGQKWLVGPEVKLAGNLRTTGGTIAFRPGEAT